MSSADVSRTPDPPEGNVRAAYGYLSGMVRKFADHSSITLLNKLQIAETAMALGPQVVEYATAGLCFYCGRHPKEDGYYTCEDCNTLDNEEARARAMEQHRRTADRVSVSRITDDTWYCTHPREREAVPGGVLPEVEKCRHEECQPPGPQVVIDAEPTVSAGMATPDEWCKRYGVVVHGPDGWRRDSKSWDEPVTEEEFWQRVAWSSCEMPALRAPIDDLRHDLARQRAIAESGVAAGCAASTGALVSPAQTTDHTTSSVSPVTDDMVRRAAEAMEDEAVTRLGRDLGTVHRDAIAKAGLSAALAGCTPVALPEPDETGETIGLKYAEWHDPHDGRRWLIKASQECDGSAVVSDGGIAIDADHAEARGVRLIAAAREARRLAAGSQVGDQ